MSISSTMEGWPAVELSQKYAKTLNLKEETSPQRQSAEMRSPS